MEKCPFKALGLTILMVVGVLTITVAQPRPLNADSVDLLTQKTLDRAGKKLFVHFDKTIYLPSEAIWFTAYFISGSDADNGDLLSVAVINNADKSITARGKFLTTGATASGYLMVPDSAAAGTYTIIAYPNKLINGRPEVSFTQTIEVKRMGDKPVKTETVSLPATADVPVVTLGFYPEGGQMVANLAGAVGLEARTQAGEPLRTKIILTADGVTIDTVTTSAFGMAKFMLTPLPGVKYEARVSGSSQHSFALPSISERGVTINLSSAITEKSLPVIIAKTLPGRHILVVHNGQKVFYVMPLTASGKPVIYKVPLDSIPAGLATLTIFDEQMMPQAERVFYAHYGRSAISIASGKAFKKKEEVKIQLDLQHVLDTAAILSVAVVQTNRINRHYFNDIENYEFLSRDLNNLPASLVVNTNEHDRRNHLELMLLIRGWRKYRNANVAEPAEFTIVPALRGFVIDDNKPLKNATTLVLKGNSTFSLLNTDSRGHFTISNEELFVVDGKPFTLFAKGEERLTSRITIEDPFLKINNDLATRVYPVKAGMSKISESDFQLPLNRAQLKVEEVVIMGKKSEPVYYNLVPGMRTNYCGDYVCMVKAINCPLPGHWTATGVPVKGEKYIRHVLDLVKMADPGRYNNFVVARNVEFIYEACETRNLSAVNLDGIHIPREFYPYSANMINDGEPLYNSTLYWKHLLRQSKDKPTELSFYTGEIDGPFSVIVQGITASGVVYKESSFEILK